MAFTNTDNEITLIYNSDDHIGKQVLAYAHTEGIPIRDIDLKSKGVGAAGMSQGDLLKELLVGIFE